MSDQLIIGGLGLIVSLIAIITPIVKLNTKIVELSVKIGALEESVRKHNNVVERTGILERDLKTNWNRVDELRADLRELERKVEK